MKKHVIASLVLTSLSAFAGPPDSKPVVPVVEPASSKDWEFRVGVPLWASALYSGDAAAGGGSAPVEVSASDILRRIDMIGALSLEVRRGRWAIMADGLYVRLSDSVNPRGPLLTTATLEIEQALVEAALSYRAVDAEAWNLDVFAGARYNHLGLKFDFDFNPARIGPRTVEGSKDWVDPYIGMQMRARVSKPVTFVLKGDIGGFGVASDFTWQAYAGFEFQIARHFYSSIGWRHLHTDYKDGNFNYDVHMTGPLIEFGVNF